METKPRPVALLLATLLQLLACAACSDAGTQPRARSYNLAVTAPAACLASIVPALDDRHVGVAKMPVWQGPVGTMEVGPIEAARVTAISRFIASAGCVVHVERRPCATPSSDVKVC